MLITGKGMSRAPNDPARRPPIDTVGDDTGVRTRSLNLVFELLVAERRRYALYVLFRRAGPVEFSTLAEEVAALEGASTDRVAAALHNVHLPKLVDTGVAEYDPEDGTVSLEHHSELFRRYLTSAAEDERQPLRCAAESASLSEF